MKLYEELQYRGLIKDEVPELKEVLNDRKITFYIGTDPTGDSLHIGHYATFSIARRLAKYGHKPILLVGAGTGLIGDPRPTSERTMIKYETMEDNYIKLKKQVKKLYGFEIVNNYDWLSKINFLDALRDFGKNFSINYMLAKDTVKSRLETGITYTEFSYMILQSIDFLNLFENNNCHLQIGGADQWGNITSGIDLIRKKTGQKAYGFTTPLITSLNGEKFGKSEGKAIWLDKNKTSTYELYQYLLNSEEGKVIEYLKILTFISKEEIDNLEISNNHSPHLREAGHVLAKEVIVDLHGEEEYNKAKRISENLFTEKVTLLLETELAEAFKSLEGNKINGKTTLEILLIENEVCTSKREASELLEAGAIKINGIKETDKKKIIDKEAAIYRKYIIISKGKKSFYIFKIED